MKLKDVPCSVGVKNCIEKSTFLGEKLNENFAFLKLLRLSDIFIHVANNSDECQINITSCDNHNFRLHPLTPRPKHFTRKLQNDIKGVILWVFSFCLSSFLEKQGEAVPIIDCVQNGFFKALGRGNLPKIPFIVRAKDFSQDAEKKIKEAGVCE